MKKILFALVPILFSVFSADSQVIKLTEQIGEFSGIVYDLCFYQSGKTLVVPESEKICFYNVETKMLTKRLINGHSKPILAISLSADTALLVSGGLDSLIVVWDVSSGAISKKLNYHHGIITSLNLNQDRSLLASGSSDKTVVVYNLASGEITYTLTDFTSAITNVKFSPDGQLLAVASLDNQIKLYQANNGQLLTSLKGHKSSVRDLCFNKKATMLYSCGDDSKVIIWDIRKKEQVKIEKVENFGSDWLLCVDVDSDYQAFVVSGLDSKIYVATNFGNSIGKINVPVNKIKLMPNTGSRIMFAVATRGKGVFIMDTMQFKTAN